MRGPLQSEEEAERFAIEAHGSQMYGQEPYEVHLREVVGVIDEFQDLPEIEPEFPSLRTAAWLHDVVEDTEVSVSEIWQRFGGRVADLVDAVTSAPGPNRRVRTAATYPKTRRCPRYGGVALKLADRIANVRRSVADNPHLLRMYRKEQPRFEEALREDGVLTPMWDELNQLFEEGSA